MADNVSILLLEDVKNLGQAGDVVSVSEGYARNALFPQGKAALATDDVKERQQHKQTAQEEAAQQELAELQNIAEQHEGTELTIQAEVKEGTELYGGIDAAQLAKEINAQSSLDVTAKQLELDGSIQTTGPHTITVRLSPEVEFTLVVNVQAANDPHEGDQDE